MAGGAVAVAAGARMVQKHSAQHPEQSREFNMAHPYFGPSIVAGMVLVVGFILFAPHRIKVAK
jgi:uncharacterized membrane protein YdjX (TVP38/TMEM64 family)